MGELHKSETNSTGELDKSVEEEGQQASYNATKQQKEIDIM